MRAIQITKYVSGPEELVVTTLPTPIPGPDEYLIAVHACALNFYDLLQIRGKYQHQPKLPWISGSEFAGVVLRAPSSDRTPAFPVGSKVFGASQGAFSTHLTCSSSSLRPVPPTTPLRSAASLMVTAPTSYAALIHRARLQPGDWVLVHAAAGGVGLAAVQVARAIGARVIASCGSSEKVDVVKRWGAEFGVVYGGGEDWAEEVKRIVGRETKGRKKGVDVVFDPVGMVNQSLKCTTFGGRIVVVGFAAGAIEKVAMNRVLLKNVSLVGLHWGQYAKEDPVTVKEVWRSLETLMAEGKFYGTVFDDNGKFQGLESVGRALGALERRETWGKVVIEVPQNREDDEKDVKRESRL
ncbi:thioredoxin-disulfide reductase [Lecanora helva]